MVIVERLTSRSARSLAASIGFGRTHACAGRETENIGDEVRHCLHPRLPFRTPLWCIAIRRSHRERPDKHRFSVVKTPLWMKIHGAFCLLSGESHEPT